MQYHLTENNLLQEIFYDRESGPIFGTQGRIQMMSAYKDRIRTRTIELLEYYYFLDGHVFLEYKEE